MGGRSSRLRTQTSEERQAVKGVQESGREQISDNFHHLPGVKEEHKNLWEQPVCGARFETRTSRTQSNGASNSTVPPRRSLEGTFICGSITLSVPDIPEILGIFNGMYVIHLNFMACFNGVFVIYLNFMACL